MKLYAGVRSIGLGYLAGMNTTGTDAICIGTWAGAENCGERNICIGTRAGKNNSINYIDNIFIGTDAGNILNSGISRNNIIAIGQNAGYEDPIAYSINIGFGAGYVDSGKNSINIGQYSSYAGGSHSSCIVLNAQINTALNPEGPNRLYIKPIRNETTTAGLTQLYYNSTTGEITHA